MINFKQDDLVQHLYNGKVYRVVTVDKVAGKIRLEECRTKGIGTEALYDVVHCLRKLENNLIAPEYQNTPSDTGKVERL